MCFGLELGGNELLVCNKGLSGNAERDCDLQADIKRHAGRRIRVEPHERGCVAAGSLGELRLGGPSSHAVRGRGSFVAFCSSK